MSKTDREWEVGMGGEVRSGGGKWRQLYLNNNKKRENFFKKINFTA